MTDSKGNGKVDKNNEEWHFSDVMIKVKPEGHNSDPKSKAKAKSKEARAPIQKNKELKLDVASVPKTKTRSAMAMEMQGLSDKISGDVYDLAAIPQRTIAFILDSFFLAGLLYIAKNSVPFILALIQDFLDKYKLQFIIPEPIVMKIILGMSVFGGLFFFIVIPISFFNHSFGKKIVGLKIRGDERYTISIPQAIKRELIMKPISIIIVAGFVTPFFSKKRLSIHDMLAHTIVIED